MIQALLRKPGAFARYHYREELFPSTTYRRAYDRLVQDHGMSSGELEYLRLLKLRAELGINAVEGLLGDPCRFADVCVPARDNLGRRCRGR